MGRYLSSAGSGPTGIFNVTFPPPGGKPPMIVQQNEIFAGYFSTFGLQTVPFNYTMTDGTPLFKNLMLVPTAADSLLNSAIPGATALVYVPQSYRCDSSGQEGGGCAATGTTISTNQSQVSLLGFRPWG